MTDHVDVLIVGAGLSGVGAAATLAREHPEKSYAILESRSASGGTWDLFRYPGIRSDSDMYTLGYRFKPWRGSKSLADGPMILDYIRETAREYDVDRHIRYDHRVTDIEWSTETSQWTVTADHQGSSAELTCSLLWACTGYYDYEHGHEPEFPGSDSFAGTLVHPQHWPDGLDYAGKKVVVVGSGATAVTLVPAMAESAGHVTMLQRTPTYILSVPGTDPIDARVRKLLPPKAAYAFSRWKNILVSTALYQLSRRRPAAVRRFLRKATVKELPVGYDVDRDFKPPYDPWDQRLCLVPDSDLFKSIRDGRASVVTDTIEAFTPGGIRLASGADLEADIIVTATGLRLLPFGGVRVVVDGEEVKVPDTMAYKALMLSGVPNLVFTVGYTNASWTLKADLVADFVMRLLRFMDDHHYHSVMPVPDPNVTPMPFMDFSAGYVLRALDSLPKQGDREPWRLKQNYLYDRRTIQKGLLTDGVLHYEH